MTDTPTGALTCQAYRPERGDEPCQPSDPITFAVTYRSRMGSRAGELNDFIPGCYRHCIAEETRASAAGIMSVTGIEPLVTVVSEAGRWPTP